MNMPKNIVALDVGDKRIGIAHTPPGTTIAMPLTTLHNDREIWSVLKHLINQQNVAILVVGLPRGMDGQETKQTQKIREFAATLESQLQVPVHLQDEAATSIKAREALDQSGKPYEKEAIDALAASYILQDFIDTNQAMVQKTMQGA